MIYAYRNFEQYFKGISAGSLIGISADSSEDVSIVISESWMPENNLNLPKTAFRNLFPRIGTLFGLFDTVDRDIRADDSRSDSRS